MLNAMFSALALSIMLPCLVAPVGDTPTALRFSYKEGETRYQKTTITIKAEANGKRTNSSGVRYTKLLTKKTFGDDALLYWVVNKVVVSDEEQVLFGNSGDHKAFWVSPNGASIEDISTYPSDAAIYSLKGPDGRFPFAGLVLPDKPVSKGDTWDFAYCSSNPYSSSRSQKWTFKLLDSGPGAQMKVSINTPPVLEASVFNPLESDTAPTNCSYVYTLDSKTKELLRFEKNQEFVVVEDGHKQKATLSVVVVQSRKPIDGVK